MAEISGTEGSVLANNVALEASEWSVSRKGAVIDRTHFGTNGLPLNAAGQKTGDFSMSGPVSTTSNLALKGVDVGSLLLFRFRVTVNLWLQSYGRVSQVDHKQNKDSGSDWVINASQYGAVTVVGV